jgi:PST family polysaccharide transporter
VGIGLYAVLAAIAFPFSWMYERDILLPMLLVLGMTYFLDALPTVQESILIRDFKQGQVTFARLFSLTIGLVVGTLAASRGWGTWALIASALATTLSQSLALTFFVDWYPKLSIDRAHVSPLIRFGGNLTATQVLGWFTESFSVMTLGLIVPDDRVGVFNRAYVIGKWPDSLPGGVLGGGLAVSFFARWQDDPDRMREGFRRATNIMYLVGIPLAVSIFLLLEPLVAVVYGPLWHEAIPIARWIILGGTALMLRQTLRHWMIASGQTSALSVTQFWTALTAVIMTIIGAQWGLMGITISTTAACIVECILLWIVSQPTTRISFTGWFTTFWRPIMISIMVALSVAVVKWIVPRLTLPPIHLAIGLVSVAGTWVLFSWLLAPDDLRFIYRLLRPRRNKPADSDPVPTQGPSSSIT